MTNHDDDLISRLKAWLVEDTESEAQAEHLLPIAIRLRSLSGQKSSIRPLSRETYNRRPERRSQPAVVCIDDDSAMIDLLTLILKKRGFEVIGATSGAQGLELVSSVKPDLVLLDLMIPDLDGWVVYQHMKADAQMRTVPVIVVSARAKPVDKEFGLNLAKVQDYITKPFSPEELFNSISRVVEAAVSGA